MSAVYVLLTIVICIGVGADSIMVFVSVWRSTSDNVKLETILARRDNDQTPALVTLVENCDILPLIPSIIRVTYGSVINPLAFSVMTTVLSFMANMVSPIIVISQLGAFMGIAMITYFVLFHLILFPAWVSVMNICQKNSECSLCTSLMNELGQKLALKARNLKNRCASIRVMLGRGITMSTENPATTTTVINNKKQSRIHGCSVFACVLISVPLSIYGMSIVLSTDFGLPLLFKEGVNISDLMFIAKHFKANLLTLSSEDNSGNREPSPQIFSPTVFPTASNSLTPTHFPISSQSPTFCPFQLVPSSTPSSSEISALLSNSGTTNYNVYVCYGIDIEKKHIDEDATARVSPSTFAPYAEIGLLADVAILCNYLTENRNSLEITMTAEDCIYNELMAATSDVVSIYERISLWLEKSPDRFFQLGVESAYDAPGNFGPNNELMLSWLCQPISCASNVSSFLDNPRHALTMINRWDHVVYEISSCSAAKMHVASITGSEEWLFPLLSDQLVQSLFISSVLSLFGSLSLLFIATWNLKLSLLIGASMIVVILVSILLHSLIYSSLIDLIDIVVLLSFVGIIVDYPTHMAIHYHQEVLCKQRGDRLSARRSGTIMSAFENRKSFGNMRAALLGPALTTIFAAVPLLQADFTLISKAGEYVVIMCVCTYLYVALVMPTLLRLVEEFVFMPCHATLSRTRKYDADITFSQEFHI